MDPMNPVSRWLELLSSRERRRAKRQESPNLVAHYWDGAAPAAHDIRDISLTGLYLLTDQRWYPGTVVTMSLQKTDVADTDPDRSIMVNAKVVRLGADGVGLALVLPEKHASSGVESFRRFFERLMGNQVNGEYLLGLQPTEADSLIHRDTEQP
jgi:hypothetical protein